MITSQNATAPKHAYYALMAKKYDFTVKAVSAEARKAHLSSPDVLYQGNVYELKCPTGNNPKKTISRNINKGIRQIKNMPNPPDEIRLIISGLGTPLTDDQVVYQVKRTMDNTKENLVELIIILKSGDIMHLEK